MARKSNGDGAQRRMFGILSFLGVRAQGLLLRRSFHWWYRKSDPWGAGRSDYDRDRYARTVERLPDRSPQRVLDVGCSEGIFTRMLAERYPSAQVLGVDISDRAIARARSQTGPDDSRLSFQTLDILNETPTGTYDLIFCAETLYYLGREQRVRLAAERLSALLEPKGVLILSHPMPEAERLHSPFAAMLTRVDEHVDDRSFRPYAVTTYERP